MARSPMLLLLLGGIAAITAGAFALPQGAKPSASAPEVAAKRAPVLVELFTSQGCSSCPPADRLAATLARQPGLVVVSRPVTYWDRLGWKDTLAREANTALQQDYARRGLAGRNGVYTPQLVIDGRFGAVGSRGDDIVAGIASFGALGDAAIVAETQGKAGYAVRLSGRSAGRAELVLLAVTRHVDVVIGSGENGGRKVGYANVLRDERKLADWTGGNASFAIARTALAVEGADRYALVLREPGGGKVLAASWLT